jgi:hypothetical protein
MRARKSEKIRVKLPGKCACRFSSKLKTSINLNSFEIDLKSHKKE